MAKYCIQFKPYDKYFNASSKPLFDVIKITERVGYKPLFVAKHFDTRPYRISKFLAALQCIHIRLKLRKGDTLLLQWPFIRCYMRVLLWAVSKSRNVQILLHDIDWVRYERADNPWTMKFLSMAKSIIVHSPSMKNLLVSNGIDGNKIVVLSAFDYLTSDEVREVREKSKEVVFAGNLAKSAFLSQMSSADLGLTLHCYGKKTENLADGLTYKGAFPPDKVSLLEGAWGLVWDGDSIETCSGSLGRYLLYNAPHKLSLYIVAHLPVIVWDQSAMAEYVRDKGLGICVASLKDISPQIEAMTDEEYATMLDNVKREAKALRQGAHLLNCLLKDVNGGGKK